MPATKSIQLNLNERTELKGIQETIITPVKFSVDNKEADAVDFNIIVETVASQRILKDEIINTKNSDSRFDWFSLYELIMPLSVKKGQTLFFTLIPKPGYNGPSVKFAKLEYRLEPK